MDRKQLRKAMSPTGWAMLIYYILINLCVLLTLLVEYVTRSPCSEAWGYFAAAGIGLLILLLWKKPRFWRKQIWARGKPMKPGAFFGLLSLFLCTQLIYQIVTIILELTLNSMGLTMMEGLESMSAGSESFGMFLYMCVLAPVTEELLCRGLVQRILMPWGKKLAILGSAFLFAIFHGNVLQAPYAFLVGLVLGYVAAEYSIAWAMVLHMLNNLVLGDMLTRLTADMSDMAYGLIIWGILLFFSVSAIVTLVRKRRAIRAWSRENAVPYGYACCFFSSAGVVTFTVLMLVSMIGTCFVLFTPL